MSRPLTVLLTGGNGMVGRNVLEHPASSQFNWVSPRRNELDLLDRSAVREFIRQKKPDIVIHAAGRVGGIQANIAAPVRFLVENLEMGVNVVLEAKAAGVRRLINLGSSCMYPRGRSEPLKEEQVLSGELEPTNEGYAIAKIATARLCEYISREDSSFAYKTLIPCNLYGRHDAFESERSHLIAAVIQKLHHASKKGVESVEIWGDGTARREFMYAGDLADAILLALTRFDSLPTLMNVGPGVDHTVNQYYEIVARVVGFTGRFTHDLTKPVGMARKLVAIGRQEAWGWRPPTSLEQGLRQTYDFFLKEHAE